MLWSVVFLFFQISASLPSELLAVNQSCLRHEAAAVTMPTPRQQYLSCATTACYTQENVSKVQIKATLLLRRSLCMWWSHGVITNERGHWSEALRRHDSPAVWKRSAFIPQMENTKYQRCHLILGANMWRVLLNLITETADTHVVKLSQVVWTPSSKHIEVCLHILRTTQPVKTAGQCNPDDVSGVILARAWTPLTVRLCYKAGVYG